MKYELKQDGRWIYIRPFPDPKLLLLLESEFTYIRKGSQFMANPLWAQVKLYNRTKGRLPIGLLNKCEQLLTRYEYKCSKELILSSYRSLKPKDDSLYDFQKSALRMVLLRGGGILQIPTGGGKTRIAIAAIKTSYCSNIRFSGTMETAVT